VGKIDEYSSARAALDKLEDVVDKLKEMKLFEAARKVE
jgi:hypothetical protein